MYGRKLLVNFEPYLCAAREREREKKNLISKRVYKCLKATTNLSDHSKMHCEASQ